MREGAEGTDLRTKLVELETSIADAGSQKEAHPHMQEQLIERLDAIEAAIKEREKGKKASAAAAWFAGKEQRDDRKRAKEMAERRADLERAYEQVGRDCMLHYLSAC